MDGVKPTIKAKQELESFRETLHWLGAEGLVDSDPEILNNVWRKWCMWQARKAAAKDTAAGDRNRQFFTSTKDLRTRSEYDEEVVESEVSGLGRRGPRGTPVVKKIRKQRYSGYSY